MRLAVLADVHGNVDALRAVLDDLKTRSPDCTVNLGDCLSGSVGCPGFEDDHPVPHRAETGTPHAAYAILDRKGGDWQVTFLRIPYDCGPAATRAAQRHRPDWAAVLATGYLGQD